MMDLWKTLKIGESPDECECGTCKHRNARLCEYPCRACKGSMIKRASDPAEYMLRPLLWESIGEKVCDGDEISTEKVDHPTHYNREGALECIDEMRLFYGDYKTAIFCQLNAHKYRYRAGQKGDGLEDLRKSDWYIKKFMELTEKVGVNHE